MINTISKNNNGSDIEAAVAVLADSEDTITNLTKMSAIIVALSHVYADDKIESSEIIDVIGTLTDLGYTTESFTYVSSNLGSITVDIDTANNSIKINDTEMLVEGDAIPDIISNENEIIDLADLASDTNNAISTQQAISSITETFLNNENVSISDILTLLNQYSFDDMSTFKDMFRKWAASGDLTLAGWINNLYRWYEDMDSASASGGQIAFSTEDPITRNLFNTVITGAVTSLVSAVSYILGAINPVFLVIGAAISVVSNVISSIKNAASEAATTPTVNEKCNQDNYVTCFGQGTGSSVDLFSNLEENNVVKYGSWSFPGGYMYAWQNAGTSGNVFNIEGRLSVNIDWNSVWNYLHTYNLDVFVYDYNNIASNSGGSPDTFQATINVKKFIENFKYAVETYKSNRVNVVYDNYLTPMYLLKGALLTRLMTYFCHNAQSGGLPYNNYTMTITRTGTYPNWYNAPSANEISQILNAIQAIYWAQSNGGESNSTRDMIHTWIPYVKDNYSYLTNVSWSNMNGWACVSSEYSWRFGPSSSNKNNVVNDILWILDSDKWLGNNEMKLNYLGGLFKPDKYYLYPPQYDATTFDASYKALAASIITITVVTAVAVFVARKFLKRRITRMATKAGAMRNELNKTVPIKKALKDFKGPGISYQEAKAAYNEYLDTEYAQEVKDWNAKYSKYSRSMWAYTIAASLSGINGLPTAGAVSPLFQTVTGSWIGSKLANIGSQNTDNDQISTSEILDAISEQLSEIKFLICGIDTETVV